MSAIGVQKAAQLLNILGQQLPGIAQADEMGVDVNVYTLGVLTRMGIAGPDLEAIKPFVTALTALVDAKSAQPKIVGAELPVMDGAG